MLRTAGACLAQSVSQSPPGSISATLRCRHQHGGDQSCTVFDSDCDCDHDPDADRYSVMLQNPFLFGKDFYVSSTERRDHRDTPYTPGGASGPAPPRRLRLRGENAIDTDRPRREPTPESCRELSMPCTALCGALPRPVSMCSTLSSRSSRMVPDTAEITGHLNTERNSPPDALSFRVFAAVGPAAARTPLDDWRGVRVT